MENCAITLQKSQYLLSLLSDADSLFSSKDIFDVIFYYLNINEKNNKNNKNNNIKKIAPKIKEMKESYELVKTLPQFKDSLQQISLIQNRLESTAKQSLLESLTSHNSGLFFILFYFIFSI